MSEEGINGRSRIRLVRQRRRNSCGAACLTMILRYFGLVRSALEVDAIVGRADSGISAHVLMRAARRCGLSAHGYRVNREGLRTLRLPAVLHLTRGHFAVLVHQTDDTACVADPSRGWLILPWNDMHDACSGVALEFAALKQGRLARSPTSTNRSRRLARPRES
jgi:ABC-type bacteriocin/lantibiotic exporter with double-glycine peptidase domain